MKRYFILLAALLLAIPTWFVLAQDSPSPVIEITGANASDLPTITINATVLDASNRPVAELSPSDFTLGGDLEGLATIVSVENVTDDSLAFASVLVIDTSTSMSGLPLQMAQEAAKLFVQSVGENDPIAIVTFDSDARLVQDFTTDTALLETVIDGLYVRGRTALYDAAVLGVEIANQAPVPRRAVILLSDGAEFGGESLSGRAAGLDAAQQLGVPVYTIGLGYGTDRSYLQELADGTNARNYESPEAEQLSEIYAELATLFRTQYILTLESTIPGDGREYAFTLQANTPDGSTNIDDGLVRAPIPVPLISFPDGTFAEPIATPTTISPIISADQEIAEISATIDGNAVEVVDGSFVIDPANLPPAGYTLIVSATDVDGDTGSSEINFETAALPPVISINNMPEGAITEPVELSLNVESQTPLISAIYAVAGVENVIVEDAENNFPYTLDPIIFSAGEYELVVSAGNEGGSDTTITVPFIIGDVAPRSIRVEGLEGEISSATDLDIAADLQSGAEISSVTLSANGETLDGVTINPLDFPAGDLALDVTVTDSNGQSTTESLSLTIAAVAPELSIGEFPELIQASTTIPFTVASQSPIASTTISFDDGEASEIEGAEIPLDIDILGNGEHSLSITVTDENGLSTTETVDFIVQLPPTPTPLPDLTGTADALAAAQETANAVASAAPLTEAAATANADATTSAQVSIAQTNVARQETLDANATRVFNDEATRNAQATINAQGTSDAQATLTAVTEETEAAIPATEATEEVAIAATEITEEPTASLTVAPPSSTPTLTVTALPTDGATLTPIGDIVEVQAQEAPPTEGNLTTWLIICGAGLFILILVAILFFGRRRPKDGQG